MPGLLAATDPDRAAALHAVPVPRAALGVAVDVLRALRDQEADRRFAGRDAVGRLDPVGPGFLEAARLGRRRGHGTRVLQDDRDLRRSREPPRGRAEHEDEKPEDQQALAAHDFLLVCRVYTRRRASGQSARSVSYNPRRERGSHRRGRVGRHPGLQLGGGDPDARRARRGRAARPGAPVRGDPGRRPQRRFELGRDPALPAHAAVAPRDPADAQLGAAQRAPVRDPRGAERDVPHARRRPAEPPGGDPQAPGTPRRRLRPRLRHADRRAPRAAPPPGVADPALRAVGRSRGTDRARRQSVPRVPHAAAPGVRRRAHAVDHRRRAPDLGHDERRDGDGAARRAGARTADLHVPPALRPGARPDHRVQHAAAQDRERHRLRVHRVRLRRPVLRAVGVLPLRRRPGLPVPGLDDRDLLGRTAVRARRRRRVPGAHVPAHHGPPAVHDRRDDRPAGRRVVDGAQEPRDARRRWTALVLPLAPRNPRRQPQVGGLQRRDDAERAVRATGPRARGPDAAVHGPRDRLRPGPLRGVPGRAPPRGGVLGQRPGRGVRPRVPQEAPGLGVRAARRHGRPAGRRVRLRHDERHAQPAPRDAPCGMARARARRPRRDVRDGAVRDRGELPDVLRARGEAAARAALPGPGRDPGARHAPALAPRGDRRRGAALRVHAARPPAGPRAASLPGDRVRPLLRLSGSLAPAPDEPRGLGPAVEQQVEHAHRVIERRPGLRVLGVAVVRLVAQVDTDRREPRLVDVLPARRTREIRRGPGLAHEVEQPIELPAFGTVLPRIAQLGPDPQQVPRDRADQVLVQLGQPGPHPAEVHVLEERPVALEVRGAAVVLAQRLPVHALPARVLDLDLAHQAIEPRPGGDRDPLRPARRLDPVAVAPVVLGVLDVVVEHEQVRVVDQVEVPLPRNVVRLGDDDGRHASVPGHRACSC